MDRQGRKKKKSAGAVHQGRNTLSMVCITLAVCVLLISVCVMSLDLHSRISLNEEQIAELDRQISAEEERTGEIQDEQAYVSSDEYVEKIAHEKIGLVYDNEMIFKESD